MGFGGRGGGAYACCFRGKKDWPNKDTYSAVSEQDEWLEARLTELLHRLDKEWAGALPLAQVWLPKNTVAGKPFWLSAEAAPFIMSDTALNEFREKSCEVVYCKGQGLPGRVWSSGACEVVQDHTYANPAHYSQRGFFLSEGIQETIGVPVFVPEEEVAKRAQQETRVRGRCVTGIAPAAVIEVLLANSKATAGLTAEGRYLLSAGGTAAVISSISRHLEACGLSLSPHHHPQQGAPPPETPPATAQPTARDDATDAEPAASSPNTPPMSPCADEDRPCVLVRASSLARTPSCRSLQSMYPSSGAAPSSYGGGSNGITPRPYRTSLEVTAIALAGLRN